MMITNMSMYHTCDDDCRLETLLNTYKSLWMNNPLWLVNASPRIPNPRQFPKEAREAAKLMISTEEAPTINAERDYSELLVMPVSAQAQGRIAA